jgi:hypothetical protein
VILTAAIVTSFMVSGVMGPAFAVRYGAHSGYCPPGTCAAFDGGAYAHNVKNCSAKNCHH